uniref:Uncharacterized protein n=1 Tax=Arion vulgaris TaxID=1028688 RepID=A0A0B7BEC6_9EUPU
MYSTTTQTHNNSYNILGSEPKLELLKRLQIKRNKKSYSNMLHKYTRTFKIVKKC